MVIMENPIKIDDLGVPLFLETSMRFPKMRFPVSEFVQETPWTWKINGALEDD